MEQIRTLSGGLSSNKVTERKRCYDGLFDLIKSKRIIKALDDGDDGEDWNSLFNSAKNGVYHMSSFLEDDYGKGLVPKSTPVMHLQRCNELVFAIVKTANRNGAVIEFHSFQKYLKKCIVVNALKLNCLDLCMTAFKELILPNNTYWGNVTLPEWTELFQMMKTLHNEDSKYHSLQCLLLMVQNGLAHTIPLSELAEEASFVGDVCEAVQRSSPRWIKETAANLFLEFCKMCLYDCRMLCCSLGEKVLNTFFLLYSSYDRLQDIYYLVLEAAVLQINIHHPNGVLKNDAMAAANSWANWNYVLRSGFAMCREMLSNKDKVVIDTERSNNRLHPLFVKFAVEVHHQVCGSVEWRDPSIPGPSDETELPPKRRRCDVGLTYIVEHIEEHRDWMWISLITEILKKYPEMITGPDYEKLLQFLSTYLPECRRSDTIGHIFLCLEVLLDVETILEKELDRNKLEVIWPMVWNFTLKSMGLNQNQEETHSLMRRLMVAKPPPQQYRLQLLTTFPSKAVTLSAISLKTLELIGRHFNVPESLPGITETPRLALLQWIFCRTKSCGHFGFPITAMVVAELILNQWPDQRSEEPPEPTNDDSNLYSAHTLTKDVPGMVVTPEKCPVAKQYIVNREVLVTLLAILEELVLEVLSKDETNVMYVMNSVLLLARLLQQMGRYGVESAPEVTGMLDRVLPKLWGLVEIVFRNVSSKRNKHERDLFDGMRNLFRIEGEVGQKIRGTVSLDLVKIFFGVLSDGDDNEEGNEDGETHTNPSSQENSEVGLRKIEVVKTMCEYCLPCDDEVQEKVLESLIDYDVQPTNPLEYKLAMIILNTVKRGASPFSPNVLNKIFLLLQKICVARYKEYVVALDVLNCLRYFYPHVAKCVKPELQNSFIVLLKPFYEGRENYGPKVSVAICQCMGQIGEVDPLGVWAHWMTADSDTDIIYDLPQFLASPYMAVRMAAIENLVKSFQYKNLGSSALYSKQKTLFDKIFSVCDTIFVREFNDTITDEAPNYEASTYYAFATIIVNNCMLRQFVLFQLLRLAYERKLSIDRLRVIIGKISKELQLANGTVILEHYLTYLLLKWSTHKFSLNVFPVALFECENNTEFYKKYVSHIIPMLINEEDATTFESICVDIGKSLTDVIEVAYPKIVAKNLVLKAVREARTEYKVTPEDISYSENIQMRIKRYLSDEMTKKLTNEQIHNIVVHIVHFVFDLDHFKQLFDIEYMIPEPDTSFLSVEIFTDTLQLLKDQIGAKKSLIHHFVFEKPLKLQQLLLELKLNVCKATSIEDKLLAFHHYVIFLNVAGPYFDSHNSMAPFLIRDTCHMLIKFIQDAWEEDGILNRLAAKYFLVLLDYILPGTAKYFLDHLVFVVSSLVSIADTDTILGKLCLAILEKIVLANKEHLMDSIRILDPFPEAARFDGLREVYEQARYGGNLCDLRTEVGYFLQASEHIKVGGCRVEGLRHLKKQLVCKKRELKRMYGDLTSLKGCLDDGSILHKLVCSLVQLTKSGNTKECLEATRCLGELGPADLKTIVLKTEDSIENLDASPTHYAILFVVQRLLEYIVDKSHEVMVDASTALRVIVSSAEGEKELKKHDKKMFDARYLHPFSFRLHSEKATHTLVEKDLFAEMIGDVELWCPSHPMRHHEFITTLTTRIMGCFVDHSFYRSLIPLVRNKVSFGEEMLPILVYVILKVNKTCHEQISTSISTFFAKHWALHWSGNGKGDSVVEQKASVQCMINTVQFVRLQNSITKIAKAELKVNYLHVALAAQFCSAYCSAILYAELWSQSKAIHYYGQRNTNTSNMSVFDIICENCEDSKELQSILRQTYIIIGDKDALHKDQLADPLNIDSQMMMYEDLNRRDLIVLVRSIQASQTHYDADMFNALKNLAVPELAVKYSTSFGEWPYECLQQVMGNLSSWDDLPLPRSADTADFHQCNYLALRSFGDGNAFTFADAIKSARLNVIDELRHESLEICKNLYAPLAKLQCLQEVEDTNAAANDVDTLKSLVRSWQLKDSINRNKFQYVEPIFRQRICALKILLSRGVDAFKDTLIDTQLDLAKMARFDGSLHIAMRSIIELMNVNCLSDEVKSRVTLEGAQISWKIDQTFGMQVLKHHLNSYKENSRIRSEALSLYGSWMVERKAESSQAISNYFLESIDVLNNLREQCEVENQRATYDMLARFADKQYQEINKYTKSPVFQDKIQNMEKLMKSAEEMRKSTKQAKQIDVRKAIAICEKQSLADRNEISNTRKEKDVYLKLAIKYYLYSLHCSSENHISIFRILSLWLENKSNSTIASCISENLPRVPSYKALQILPQLVPHITNKDSDAFGKEVNLLIQRCAIDHPHHAIPIILSVANSDKDAEYTEMPENVELNEPRVVASKQLIEKLRKHSSVMAKIIEQVENTVNAVIEVAYYDTKHLAGNAQAVKFPHNFKINKVKGYSYALLPTITLPVNINCKYENITGIHRYHPQFNLVGGLNAPKRVKCIGTDGIERNQLVKGKDDLRQDAVMQQVFTIINRLLSTEKSTENLLIRTYKIIPMSKRSGILEWVDNSMPLGDYLVGKQGAHTMYNAGDISPEKCRDEFRKLANFPNDVKLTKYLRICERFRPAFHKFFETTFVHPTVWYEKKRSYTHSVATTSMCGYILGLGDRHVNNILIDRKTAEVIHIDFGIAFEQGKVLPTAETVPFRLTRDIEAGMGIFGAEGTFRRCCEKTMEVLRNNASTILAILEVLLYDPLYDWSVTPNQAYSKQFDSDSDDAGARIIFSSEDKSQLNVRAERALNRLSDKLQGTESGGFMSVEGQVTWLIQQARDPVNLSRLFQGWQPYL